MKMKIKVWTECYRPFVMGGDVWHSISTEHECTGPYMYDTFKLYIAKNPITGQIHIVEGESGAFVGTSLDEVKNDIKTADLEIMKKQLIAAMKRGQDADPLTNSEFWKLFK